MTARSIRPAGIALFVSVLIGFTQPGLAADPDYCGQYASKAVQAQLRNIQYRCGFTGRRWSTDYNDHFGWCFRTRWVSADVEERARRRLLGSCRDY